MPAKRIKAPSYRRHKASGQAVVTLDGKDFYLGPHGTKASHTEYDRVVAEWLANGRQLPRSGGGPTDVTINELVAAYWQFARGYYVKNGRPTDERLLENELMPVGLGNLSQHLDCLGDHLWPDAVARQNSDPSLHNYTSLEVGD